MSPPLQRGARGVLHFGAGFLDVIPSPMSIVTLGLSRAGFDIKHIPQYLLKSLRSTSGSTV